VEFWIRGQRASLRVVPLNWAPEHAGIDVLGMDCHLEPVNLLRLVTPEATTHRLLTAIEVVPHSGQSSWQFTGDDRGAILHNDSLEVSLGAAGRLMLSAVVRREGQPQLTAECHAGAWSVG
jgi:hypothetical protein